MFPQLIEVSEVVVGLEAVEVPASAAADFGPVRALRVLHVTESWGSGVASAVHAYVEAAPGHDHWLLMASRAGEDPQLGLDRLLRARRVFSDGHVARIRDIAKAYREIQPHIVHAHSSYAGFYARVCPSIPRERIVYSPHCYAFERTDVSASARYGFRLAEALLARRTGVVAAVSPREAELAQELRRGQRVVYVPNVIPKVPEFPDGPQIPETVQIGQATETSEVVRIGQAPGVAEIPEIGQAAAALEIGRAAQVPGIMPGPQAGEIRGAGRRTGRELVAVTVGRICAQKDPAFLAEAVRECGPGVSWVWAGDGDPALRRTLEAAGVTVTGWLSRDQVLRLLCAADVYVHTAAWESAPISVLEAAGAALPVVARDIPPLRSLGMSDLVATPGDCAAAVQDLGDASRRAEVAGRLRAALSGHTARQQADRLSEAYALAAGLR